jgi:hypothetical protein
MHRAHIHNDMVNSGNAVINARKVSMDDALGRDVGLTDAFKIPVNDLEVYAAIKITLLDVIDDLAR